MRGVKGATETLTGDGDASKDHAEALKIDGEALKCENSQAYKLTKSSCFKQFQLFPQFNNTKYNNSHINTLPV